MHICFNALDYPSPTGGSGVGNQVRLLGRALVQTGHRVTVIALSQRGLPALFDDDGIRVHRIERGNLHWYLSRVPLVGRLLTLAARELELSWVAYKKIKSLHREDPFDIIEGTETGMFWVARRMPNIPCLIRLHGEPYTFRKYTPGMRLSAGLSLSRLLQRMALRRMRFLASPSQRHAREIKNEMGGSHPDIMVIPNMISSEMTDQDTPLPAPCRLSQDPWERIRGPIVLYVGRLDRSKGVLVLLEACRQVLHDLQDVHLVFAGASHPTLRKEELANSLQCIPFNDRIHFLGHLASPRLFAWYRRAAVCVLPSYYETFGLAAVEPMAFGVPVIATNVGGLPEVVENGVSGLLVPPGDPTALAFSITKVLTDPCLRRRLGEKGRERVGKFFVLPEHIGSNLELYRLGVNGLAGGHKPFLPLT